MFQVSLGSGLGLGIEFGVGSDLCFRVRRSARRG